MQLQGIWILISVLVLAALSGCTTTGSTILIGDKNTLEDYNGATFNDYNQNIGATYYAGTNIIIDDGNKISVNDANGLGGGGGASDGNVYSIGIMNKDYNSFNVDVNAPTLISRGNTSLNGNVISYNSSGGYLLNISKSLGSGSFGLTSLPANASRFWFGTPIYFVSAGATSNWVSFTANSAIAGQLVIKSPEDGATNKVGIRMQTGDVGQLTVFQVEDEGGVQGQYLQMFPLARTYQGVYFFEDAQSTPPNTAEVRIYGYGTGGSEKYGSLKMGDDSNTYFDLGFNGDNNILSIMGTGIHIKGTIESTGKGTFLGGVDPPYISFSNETHASIKRFAKEVNEHEKIMQFWNGEKHRMEIYEIETGNFYTLLGEKAD